MGNLWRHDRRRYPSIVRLQPVKNGQSAVNSLRNAAALGQGPIGRARRSAARGRQRLARAAGSPRRRRRCPAPHRRFATRPGAWFAASVCREIWRGNRRRPAPATRPDPLGQGRHAGVAPSTGPRRRSGSTDRRLGSRRSRKSGCLSPGGTPPGSRLSTRWLNRRCSGGRRVGTVR